MTVRNSLLAILTLGPAYGLQLHGELLARAAHRASVNVGQIYGTLDRLVAVGLVQQNGSTADGLPLYSLTDIGSHETERWISGDTGVDIESWSDMLDQILVVSSLPHTSVAPLLGAYRSALVDAAASAASEPDPESPQASLARIASTHHRGAVEAFVTATGEFVDAVDASGMGRHLTSERPRRGRKSVSDDRLLHRSVT